MANPRVDELIDRSERWAQVMAALRPILLGSGLSEEIKWGKPCYCHEGANVAIVQEMNDFLALMFFKGALLADRDRLLESQGPNSRSARRICFRSVDDVTGRAATIAAYLREAIDVEEAGLAVAADTELELVDELRRRLDHDSELRAAFEALTPGRRREYHLHVSGAKQASTRERRVDACVPSILAGKGLRDR